MKPLLTRILLPVSTDRGFEQAAVTALSLAKHQQAEIFLAEIIDDSNPSETVPLPFHEKEFMHHEITDEPRFSRPLSDLCADFMMDASKDEVDVREVRLRGHAATQTLLLSRFADLLVLSRSAHFDHPPDERTRKVNPVLEILDQTIIPVLIPGRTPLLDLSSAALFFDGGPCATRALHSLGRIVSSVPKLPLFIRVSSIDPVIARSMGEECERFLRSKGMLDISIEYSDAAPHEAIQTEVFTPVDLVAMGIRSRHSYHDLHVGEFARHFLEKETMEAVLFC